MTESSIAEKWAAKAFQHGHQMTLEQTIQAAIDEATAELRANADLGITLGTLENERAANEVAQQVHKQNIEALQNNIVELRAERDLLVSKMGELRAERDKAEEEILELNGSVEMLQRQAIRAVLDKK